MDSLPRVCNDGTPIPFPTQPPSQVPESIRELSDDLKHEDESLRVWWQKFATLDDLIE